MVVLSTKGKNLKNILHTFLRSTRIFTYFFDTSQQNQGVWGCNWEGICFEVNFFYQDYPTKAPKNRIPPEKLKIFQSILCNFWQHIKTSLTYFKKWFQKKQKKYFKKHQAGNYAAKILLRIGGCIFLFRECTPKISRIFCRSFYCRFFLLHRIQIKSPLWGLLEIRWTGVRFFWLSNRGS